MSFNLLKVNNFLPSAKIVTEGPSSHRRSSFILKDHIVSLAVIFLDTEGPLLVFGEVHYRFLFFSFSELIDVKNSSLLFSIDWPENCTLS